MKSTSKLLGLSIRPIVFWLKKGRYPYKAEPQQYGVEIRHRIGDETKTVMVDLNGKPLPPNDKLFNCDYVRRPVNDLNHITLKDMTV